MLAAGVRGQSEHFLGHRRKMEVESHVTQEEIRKELVKPIYWEMCLLLLCLHQQWGPHCMDEFSQGNLPSSELQIYPWMDATLKELISSVKEVYQEAGKKNTLQFRNFRSFKTWLLSKGDWQHPVQEKGD